MKCGQMKKRKKRCANNSRPSHERLCLHTLLSHLSVAFVQQGYTWLKEHRGDQSGNMKVRTKALNEKSAEQCTEIGGHGGTESLARAWGWWGEEI